jgi:hypothetical protein
MPWTFYNASGQKLNTRSSSITHLDIDGATDIGADIVDADLFIIDDGAGGTNRKTAASRIVTYVGADTDTRSGVAKFWVQYNGANGTVVTSYNVTSVSDDGVGDHTVTIATDFSGADWCVGAFPGAQNLGDILIASTQSAGAIRIMGSLDTGAAADMNEEYVWGFGDQ